MKRNSILRFRSLSLLPLCLAVSAQVISSNQPAPQGPVSYASSNQLNTLLSQLEEASQAAQSDLAKMRVEKWKTDSGSKRQAEGNAESIQRNLRSALPEIIAELKASPTVEGYIELADRFSGLGLPSRPSIRRTLQFPLWDRAYP